MTPMYLDLEHTQTVFQFILSRQLNIEIAKRHYDDIISMFANEIQITDERYDNVEYIGN